MKNPLDSIWGTVISGLILTAILYLAANRYQQDDYHPYLFKTKDYGKTWTKITAGMTGPSSAQ